MRLARVRALALSAAILLAGFAWGFLAQRQKIFPHAILRRIAFRAGVRIWQRNPIEITPVAHDSAAIATIPYLDMHPDSSRKPEGAIVVREDLVAPGYNFYSVPGKRAAYLIDMHGKLLWRWTLARYSGYSKIRPNLDIGFTHLYPNGDVLAFVGRNALLRLDRNSNIVWQFDGYLHHDAWVCRDGSILTLVKHQRFDSRIHPEAVLLDDSIATLSGDGRLLGEVSILDVVGASPYAFLLPQPSREKVFDTLALDVFHANHVEVYDGSLERMSPLFRKGNILVSLKDIDSVAILEGTTHQILWLWGPMNLTRQHHATILDNGDVMMFDNGSTHSRVVEVDPRTNRIVWTYSNPDADFYSMIRGSCQRLANGNTLICVSEAGYAIEVSRAGEVVWKFVTPSTGGGRWRDSIFRMTRIPLRELEFLRGPAAS